MRSDPIQFALATTRANREPRFVIKIEYPVGSIYLTSHADITGVPGDVIYGVIQKPSAFSQRIYPDEGRSDIGAFSFTVVDKNKALTESLRDQLQNEGAGIRGKTVKFYLGYKGFDFTAFVLFTTQIVSGRVGYWKGSYSIRCSDITREQRQQIFEPVTTTLSQTISASATTIIVNSAAAFEMVAHGPSFSDAPSATVGYIRIDDEIIRYTGTTPNSFTGCTRGVFNTRAVEHVVDTNPNSRGLQVEEFIYLELPGPKLALVIMLGTYGGITVPDHWHLGIDSAFIRTSDFTSIGPDLWNTSDDADPACFIARFDGLKEQDGKRFLEKEIYLLLGCFSPVYADGTLGLRRRVPVISQAASVFTLTEDNIVELGELSHDQEAMHNFIKVDWAYDEVQDEFIRKTAFLDAESQSIHGKSRRLDMQFRGLHSQRAGDATIGKRLDALRDSYNEPPQTIEASILGSLNGIEVGDIGRIRVPETILRDYVNNAGQYNRAFEVQQRVFDAYTGEVTLQLFGSTSRPLAIPLGTNATNLADAFYSSAGTALNTVITITGSTMATGSHTLTGNASLTNAGAIYYHLGDLIIPQGCNLTISANVQLRIMGFLTLNGTINGVGGGKAGVSDPGTGAWDATFAGNPGYIGHSRGWDGALVRRGARQALVGARTIAAQLTRGQHDVFPVINLSVVGGSLLGLPSDMRGTGGAPGGRLASQIADVAPGFVAAGGAGVAGGAGLAIICRGMSLGASASITLDGANPAATGSSNIFDIAFYPGIGGAGGPGALLLLLDGDTLSPPVFNSSNFSAKTGAFTQLGNPLPTPEVPLGGVDNALNPQGVMPPVSGYADPSIINGEDYSAAARLIQYIPPTDAPTVDVQKPPAPTGMSARAGVTFIAIHVDWVATQPNDWLEVYASIDNDRTNATLVGRGRTAEIVHSDLPVLHTGYYWSRIRREYNDRSDLFSEWFPLSATGGVSISTLNPNGWTPVTTNGGGATMVVNAGQIQKSSGTTAWDSQVYSRESFAAGCSLSFRPLQANAAFMIGLNTDPATDAGFTSIDYAWYCLTDGTLNIYESGAGIASPGSYDTSTTLAITYDGAYVRYLRNGTEVRKVPRIGERFSLDSSWYTPGAAAASVQYAPLAPAPNTVALVPRGNCVTYGNGIQKAGGSAAWDSDCYSLQAFAGACSASCRFPAHSAIATCMFGLNSDQTTDQHYASIDYAFQLYFDGSSAYRWYIYENGTSVVGETVAAADDRYEVKYDGQWVRYYRNSVLVREKFDPGKVFFLDSSFYYPGTILLDVGFMSSPGVTPSPFVIQGAGACRVSDNNIIKQASSDDWVDAVHSIAGYPVCHVSFKPNQTDAYLMVGLNSDPTLDSSFTSLDHAWYCHGSGVVAVYENGIQIGDFGAYTRSTLLAISYDGSTIRYYKDDLTTPVYTSVNAGKTMFMDSSFYSANCGINSLRFGPTTNLAVISTPQVDIGAVTATYTAADAGPDTYNAGTVPGAPNYYLRIDGEPVPIGSVVRAILTTDISVASAGQLGSIFLNMDWGGSQASDVIECYDTIQQSFSTQREFTALPADTAWTLTCRVAAPGASVPTFKNTRVHVEVIKR